MKKISMLFISFMLLSLLMLLGCTHEKVSNREIKAKLQTNKLESDDKAGEVDWQSKYKVINKVKFYVLINEYLDNNDKNNPAVSILVRDYWCFDGTGEWNQVYPVTNKIAYGKSNEINSALDFKNQMKKSNSNSLKLMENTIVSDNVLNQWNEEKYDAKFEYSKESPKGLTYGMLKKSTP